MMSQIFRRWLPIAGGLVLLALLGNGVLSYYNTRVLVQYQQRVDHSRAVITAVKALLVTVDDAETGQRGYIITGKISFLGPYRRAAKHINQRLTNLQTLTTGDPPQQSRVRRLKTLVAAKLHDIRVSINLRKHGHKRAARQDIASGRGKKLMGDIRQVIADMQTWETRRLAQESGSARQSDRQATETIVIATLANVALLGFVFFLVQRSVRRRDQISQERARLLEREHAARMHMEQVAAEREALLRQKDEFLSAAAHDLKTPLTIIKGIAQLLQQRADRAAGAGLPQRVPELSSSAGPRPSGPTPSDSRKPDAPAGDGPVARSAPGPEMAAFADGLRRIDTTATRMVNLVNEILDSTRIQMGRPLNLVKRPTDLLALAHRVVAEIQQGELHHHIHLVTDVEELTGTWDEGRLERVLGNILFNAIKYSPDGGDITVRITKLKNEGAPGSEPAALQAVLSVSDQGLGIPEEDLPHIFERFRRASNVASAIPGTGIGLASVSQIVKQHGGTITVESREGQGSTFTILLPLESGVEQEARAEQADGAAART